MRLSAVLGVDSEKRHTWAEIVSHLPAYATDTVVSLDAEAGTTNKQAYRPSISRGRSLHTGEQQTTRAFPPAPAVPGYTTHLGTIGAQSRGDQIKQDCPELYDFNASLVCPVLEFYVH